MGKLSVHNYMITQFLNSLILQFNTGFPTYTDTHQQPHRHRHTSTVTNTDTHLQTQAPTHTHTNTYGGYKGLPDCGNGCFSDGITEKLKILCNYQKAVGI